MILSDFDLENYIRDKRLVVAPFHQSTIRENGLDLRLGDEIAIKNALLSKKWVLDPYNAESLKKEYVVTKSTKEFIVPAMSQVLITTMEYLELPDNLMGFIELAAPGAGTGLACRPR